MARATVIPETLKYPDSDGLPMAENEFQLRSILYANSALANYYRQRDDIYVVGNLLLYYEPSPRPGVPGKSVSPDLMVVLGAPKHMRSSYLLWAEPKAPDFVLEVASESTYRSDLGDKRDIYETKIGVSEYWLYDPTGAHLKPPLQGFRLVEGRYEPMPTAERADGALTGHSEVLGLELRLYPDDRFRFHDPASGQDLLSHDETDAAWQQEAQARKEAESRLERTESRLQESEAARRARWKPRFGTCGGGCVAAPRSRTTWDADAVGAGFQEPTAMSSHAGKLTKLSDFAAGRKPRHTPGHAPTLGVKPGTHMLRHQFSACRQPDTWKNRRNCRFA